MRTVADIPRNDVAACVAYYERNGITLDDGQIMLQLQDDPTELLKVMRGWKATTPPDPYAVKRTPP